MANIHRSAALVALLVLGLPAGSLLHATEASAQQGRDRNDRAVRTLKEEPTSTQAAINFGDDSSDWSNDGECDDPRFTGPGMTSTILLDEDIMHDATDCRTAYEAGKLSIDFGDDSSDWSNDNECDDPRFSGPGMTTTVLLDEDIKHDATDCRTAFEAGQLVLGPEPFEQEIAFGDDASQWSNDNECDDPRFTGPGMTATALLDEDIMHDATDCRTAYEAGRLSINFGDDASQWSNDKECDDSRFSGPGMTGTILLDEDIGHDATDCRTAFEAGQLSLKPSPGENATPPSTPGGGGQGQVVAGIDFGDDASTWSNDNECDDSRFTGPGMTATILLDEDIGHDATDCRTAYEAGQLSIDFGDDASQWSNDNECDDPRFSGPGMTTTVLLDEDIKHDATDCRTAFEAGQLTLGTYAAGGGGPQPSPSMPGDSPGAQDINFGDDASTWSNDGECDDPRFTGPGMTTTVLLDEDIMHDATDCRTAYEAGQLTLK